MRSLLKVAVPVLAGLFLLSACAPAPEAPAGPLTSHAGKALVINYWALWCAPCREEIPELNALQAARPDDLVVIGVNFDGVRGTKLKEAAEELGIEFTLLEEDPIPGLGFERPNVLPTTFLFRPDGSLAGRLVGPQTRDSLEAVLSGEF